MPILDVSRWLDETERIDRFLCAKRLSYGDVCEDDEFRGSVHLPRVLLRALDPRLVDLGTELPTSVRLRDRSGTISTGTVGWYGDANSALGRRELRLCVPSEPTSPLRDPASVGALAIFVFSGSLLKAQCKYFVCGSIDEEAQAEERLGPVEPGYAVMLGVRIAKKAGGSDGLLGPLPYEIPVARW